MIIKLLTQLTAGIIKGLEILSKILHALNYIIKVIKYGGEHGREIVRCMIQVNHLTGGGYGCCARNRNDIGVG